jgi:hypothetical protein
MKGGHQPLISAASPTLRQRSAELGLFGRSRNIWLRNVTAWVNTASLDLRLRTLSASSSSILGD